MRLNQYVQQKYWVSRRSFVDLVKKGNVFLDWEKVESYSCEVFGWEKLNIKGIKIDWKVDFGQFNDELVIFNKPVWYVCSKNDKYNKTIYNLLPNKFSRYYYIGRLDKDSRWLLLLTNNSKLVNQFEHPSNYVEKEYEVIFEWNIDKKDIAEMKKWINVDWHKMTALDIQKSFDKNFLKIVLVEWKNRQIRKMLDYFNVNVTDLKRVREGKYKLWNIKEWEFRILKI